MNNTLQYVNIKSTWLEINNGKSKISEIGFEAFGLYLHLFKFRIARQEVDYVFCTSLGLLRKVSGRTTDQVVNCLRVLKLKNIIKLKNLSRWDYLKLDNGKYDDNRILLIEAIDSPESFDDEEKDNDIGTIVDIDFLHTYYSSIGLNEKYYPLYTLLRKLSSGNIERKSFMSIENMAKIIGFDKDTVNRMIKAMNKKKVLNSVRKSNSKDGYMYEHHLCYGYKYLEEFQAAHFPKEFKI